MASKIKTFTHFTIYFIKVKSKITKLNNNKVELSKIDIFKWLLKTVSQKNCSVRVINEPLAIGYSYGLRALLYVYDHPDHLVQLLML